MGRTRLRPVSRQQAHALVVLGGYKVNNYLASQVVGRYQSRVKSGRRVHGLEEAPKGPFDSAAPDLNL